MPGEQSLSDGQTNVEEEDDKDEDEDDEEYEGEEATGELFS